MLHVLPRKACTECAIKRKVLAYTLTHRADSKLKTFKTQNPIIDIILTISAWITLKEKKKILKQ